ncbi:MAG: argininosuccinate synthase, partial [Tissierellia bacterium]|nr:argininosuccinate synthase [Tissierellia bacterium]
MKDVKFKKVALAYSGGLDTSVIIPWLKENYDCEVIAVVGNVGQDPELEGLEEKAINSGASAIFIENIEDEFIDNYAFPALQAGAKYESRYLLGTATARPVIAKRLVEIALQEGCDAVAHGCTGKGNDQIRFEMAIKYFAPDMPVIAPWRIWDIKSREEEFAFAEERGIPLKISKETNYSKDMNVWHLSHEGLELEDPSNEPNYDKMLELTVSPEKAPDEGTYVTVSFEEGIPVAVNGEKMKGSAIVRKLNELGGKNGIGIADIVENRLVGMKCRGVYETPGGTILYHTHKVLESLTLDRDTIQYKETIAIKFAELVYTGKWFTPLREALSEFVTATQKTVTGDVKVKLYKGNIISAGVTSPYSLYSEEYATFGEDEVFDQYDATGF